MLQELGCGAAGEVVLWCCGELSVVDERGGAGLRKCVGNDIEQGVAFDLAVGAEAGCDAVEVGVVLAGVADELPCVCRREGVEELAKDGCIEVSCGGDTEGAAGGLDGAVAQVGVGVEVALQCA